MDLESELLKAKKCNDETLEKLHDMEEKCLELQGNLNRFVLVLEFELQHQPKKGNWKINLLRIFYYLFSF